MTKKHYTTNPETFWQIRAAKYDKLFWTKDQSYLDDIVRLSDLHKGQLVLDVGTGTGAVTNAIKEYVHHVVAIDSSDSMLEKGDWTGVSTVKWDIGNSLFKDAVFHRVTARMVFHHIIDHLDRAVLRCYDLLKEGGKLIVAEGVPPVDDPDVIEWYTEMFKPKEERRTFTPDMLVNFLKKNGFNNVTPHIHLMDNFSIKNWLENSGLDKKKQNKILDMHRNAPNKVKDVYHMRITEDDCICRTKNVIVVGEK